MPIRSRTIPVQKEKTRARGIHPGQFVKEDDLFTFWLKGDKSLQFRECDYPIGEYWRHIRQPMLLQCHAETSQLLPGWDLSRSSELERKMIVV